MSSSFRPPLADPVLNYRDYQRQRQLTLGDLLLENRIILLQGVIHDANANELVMKLLYLQSENRRKDINFYINAWVGGDPLVADMTTQGAGSGDPGFGLPDGTTTAADVNFYVNLWIAGCP